MSDIFNKNYGKRHLVTIRAIEEYWLSTLTKHEARVLLFINSRTYKYSRLYAPISIRHFTNGVFKKSDRSTLLAKTGMSKQTIISACRSLKDKDLIRIKKVNMGPHYINEYSINFTLLKKGHFDAKTKLNKNKSRRMQERSSIYQNDDNIVPVENHMIVYNIIEIIDDLSIAQFLILIFINARTNKFGKSVEIISLSDFVYGVYTSGGALVQSGLPLAKRTISTALSELISRQLVKSYDIATTFGLQKAYYINLVSASPYPD